MLLCSRNFSTPLCAPKLTTAKSLTTTMQALFSSHTASSCISPIHTHHRKTDAPNASCIPSMIAYETCFCMPPSHTPFGRMPSPSLRISSIGNHVQFVPIRCPTSYCLATHQTSIAATTPLKLALHSVLCVFLGYTAETKGYRCYNPVTHRVITSRHIYFDESVYPFRSCHPATAPPRPPPAPTENVLIMPTPRPLPP
jgi:hypothetical protein